MTDPTPVEALGPASVATGPIEAELGGSAKLNRGGFAWSIFEGGRDPYVILMTIFIFMPYVSATMVGDPVKGQELISRFQQYAGWTVMATGPFLGASIDKLGPRKAWLALTVVGMVPLIAFLWFAKPDLSGLSIMATMTIAYGVNVLFAWSEILHNSMLIRAAGLKGAHSASGLALALGNAASVVALAFTAWAFALPGKVKLPGIPAAPLFGLDPLLHQPERIVGPMSAILLVVGTLPILLFTPDAPRGNVSVVRAFGDGARSLWRMLMTVREYRDAFIFLVSRSFYVDGMTAVLVFFGIYATGVMHWHALDMLMIGIILTVLAVAGGFLARAFDAVMGPRRAVQMEIAMSFLGIVALLGMGPDHILYLWHYDPTTHVPLWNGPFFRTLPDVVFILIGFSNAVFITAHYASSRTLLTRLTPPEQTGAFFGAYAVSGTATVWLAPMMVNIGTRMFHSQQGGFAMIAVLLAVGFVGLLFVRKGNREFGT